MNEEENNVNQDPITINTDSTGNTGSTSERKGFNITSLVLGIISVITICWCWYASVPSAIIAIIFSVAGKNDAGRGMGIAGLVLGIIGLVINIAFLVLVAIGVAALGTAATLY